MNCNEIRGTPEQLLDRYSVDVERLTESGVALKFNQDLDEKSQYKSLDTRQ